MDYNINKEIPMPYYFQIQTVLKKAIEAREWKPGDFIPAERELSKNFQVSRITTRKALDNLVREGLIKIIKGKGAVVAKPKIEEQIFYKLMGTYQDLKEKGLKITNKILSYRIIEPEDKVLENLDISPGDKVFDFERLRFIDGEPYHYSKTFMPQKRCPEFNYKLLIEKSLFKLLEEYGLKIYRVKRVLEASVASMEESKLFKIKIGSPILTFYNTAYINDGTPIEYTTNKIRGDMSKFNIEISMEKIEDLSYEVKSLSKNQ